jgi:conjugal transfer pilin signal peptidase TrbI
MCKKIAALIFIILIFSLNLFPLNLPYGLRINDSSSLPYYLLWSVNKLPNQIERGMIVAFSHPMSKELFAKEIAGIPGDYIKVENWHVYINGVKKGKILEETSFGDKLTPIKDGIIEEGFYFVQGTHERSFDSRYEDFGLINVSAIRERLWPIL